MCRDLSLESKTIQTQNCAPTQCTVWSRNESVTKNGCKVPGFLTQQGGGGLRFLSYHNLTTHLWFMKLISQALQKVNSPKALKRRCFGQNFRAAGKFLKKHSKSSFWALFGKLRLKIAFFRRVLPPQN